METKIINKIKKIGFNVTERSKPKKIVLTRYKNIPEQYMGFLNQFKKISNSDETTWFNSIEDFNNELDNEFKWNEFELLSRDWCEGDEDELKMIEKFWVEHIPILMSVKHQYEFLAIDLTNEHYGKIVHGIEPEFENVIDYCKDFDALITLFENTENKNYWI